MMAFLFHFIIILTCFFLASKIIVGITLSFVIITIASLAASYLFIYPEKGIYFLYLSSVFFNPHAFQFPFRMHLTHFIIVITLAGLIFQNILLKSRNWIKTKIDFALLFFFCGYVLSFINVSNINEYIKKIFILGMYIAGFFITTNVLNSRKKIEHFLNFILITTPFAIIISTIQLIRHPFRGEIFRLYGQFSNPNGFADFLILIFPLLLCFIWTIEKFTKRLLSYISVTIILTGIILTYSRSSWLSLLFSIAILMLFSNKKILILVIFIPMMLIGSYYIITDSIYNIINFKDHTLLARKVLWEKAIDKIKESPILGKGAGSFYESAFPYDIKYFTGSFNIFLTIWAETGIFSLFIYFYILFIILKISLKNIIFKYDSFNKYIILGSFSGLAASTLHSFFEDMLFNVMTNWMLGIITALIFCSIYILKYGDKYENPYFSEINL